MAIKFNLTSIPKGAKITKAELGLYAYGVASGTSTTLKNGSKSIYKISAEWAEGTIKWTGAPVTASTALASSSNSSINVWEPFDVTSDVKAIVETNAANNGYLLRFPNSGFGLKYRSSEYTTTANRPKLTITYELADAEAPQVSVTAPTIEDNLTQGVSYTIKWTATDNTGIVSRAIYFSSNNGTSWTKVDSADGNTGSFKWTVPVVTSANCLIRIDAYDAAGNKGTAKSGKFSIEPVVGILPQWSVPSAGFYKVTVTTIQGRMVASFVSNDLRRIDQALIALPSGIHVVHIATPDRKFNRKMRFVR